MDGSYSPVVDYKVVPAHEVKEYLRMGWQPWGSAVALGYMVHQPMVRYEDSEQVN